MPFTSLPTRLLLKPYQNESNTTILKYYLKVIIVITLLSQSKLVSRNTHFSIIRYSYASPTSHLNSPIDPRDLVSEGSGAGPPGLNSVGSNQQTSKFDDTDGSDDDDDDEDDDYDDKETLKMESGVSNNKVPLPTANKPQRPTSDPSINVGLDENDVYRPFRQYMPVTASPSNSSHLQQQLAKPRTTTRPKIFNEITTHHNNGRLQNNIPIYTGVTDESSQSTNRIKVENGSEPISVVLPNLLGQINRNPDHSYNSTVNVIKKPIDRPKPNVVPIVSMQYNSTTVDNTTRWPNISSNNRPQLYNKDNTHQRGHNHSSSYNLNHNNNSKIDYDYDDDGDDDDPDDSLKIFEDNDSPPNIPNVVSKSPNTIFVPATTIPSIDLTIVPTSKPIPATSNPALVKIPFMQNSNQTDPSKVNSVSQLNTEVRPQTTDQVSSSRPQQTTIRPDPSSRQPSKGVHMDDPIDDDDDDDDEDDEDEDDDEDGVEDDEKGDEDSDNIGDNSKISTTSNQLSLKEKVTTNHSIASIIQSHQGSNSQSDSIAKSETPIMQSTTNNPSSTTIAIPTSRPQFIDISTTTIRPISIQSTSLPINNIWLPPTPKTTQMTTTTTTTVTPPISRFVPDQSTKPVYPKVNTISPEVMNTPNPFLDQEKKITTISPVQTNPTNTFPIKPPNYPFNIRVSPAVTRTSDNRYPYENRVNNEYQPESQYDADLTRQIYDKAVEIYQTTSRAVQTVIDYVWSSKFEINSATFEPLLMQPLFLMCKYSYR